MFFGKRRKPKPSDRVPKEFGGDDFGFEEVDERPKPAEERARPSDDRSRPSSRDPGDDFDFASTSSTGGRSVDDPTFVGSRSHASTFKPPEAPPARSLPRADDEDLPDATRVIGPPIDLRATLVAWLVAASGPARGRDYRLGTQPTRVGTAPECEIRLGGDAYVSTIHAEILVEGEEAVVRDLGSTNGTYRNDERIRESVLRDGDRLRFGLSEFVFKSVRL